MSTRAPDDTAEWAGSPDVEAIRVKSGRENFPVASHLLPRGVRHHLLTVYAFARMIDDIGDEAAGERLLLLDMAEAELDRAFAGQATHPVFQELSRSLTACHLDRQPFFDLIEANRQDQRVHRYRTFEELRGYCRLSAEPVGRIVLAVTGTLTPELAEWSDEVCSGLQLVEHWQDVGEDFGRGRVYLPQEDMRAFHVTEHDLSAPCACAELKRLMAFEVDRARALLHAARPLVGSLQGRVRVAVSGFAAGGLSALDAIEAADFDVLGHPAKGKRGALLLHSFRLLAGSRERA